MHKLSQAARVAQRFAASRPMKPEKMTALLLKLRKGAEGSVRMPELVQVLEHLGGWKLEENLVLHQTHGKDYTTSYSGPRASVEATWTAYKKEEVATLPSPSSLVKWQRYYQDVSEIKDKPNGEAYFTYKAWQAVLGVAVISPNHKIFQTVVDHDAFLAEYPQNNGLLKWLKKETPYLDQINEKLGMDSVEAEKERKRQEQLKVRLTANVGTCPCCFGLFKLTSKTKHGRDKKMPGMVLHGYKRPGTGYVHGNCFGQDWPPFELSKEGTVALLTELEPRHKAAEDYLLKLQAGKVEILHERRTFKEIRPGDFEWTRTLAQAVYAAQASVEDLASMIKTCERHLTGWKPTALPGTG
jgi:hypothetical protein